MAHPLNERTNTSIEYRTTGGYRVNKTIIGVYRDVADEEHMRHACRLVEEGNTEVSIVTTKSTWRGKNGKVTRTELSRIPVEGV